MMVPRVSYLAAYYDRIFKHFQDFVISLPSIHSQMWIEAQGTPLKWYDPIPTLRRSHVNVNDELVIYSFALCI